MQKTEVQVNANTDFSYCLWHTLWLLPPCSHYQVIVLRLSSRASLPSESPDSLYPRGYPFSTHAEVHSEDTPRPYIAAEVDGASLSLRFTLGLGGVTNGSNISYVNGRLSPGTLYTCFLRAFPKTFYDRPFKRRKRAAGLSLRQYDIFSSSNFLPAQETGER